MCLVPRVPVVLAVCKREFCKFGFLFYLPVLFLGITVMVQGCRKWLAVADRTKREDKGDPDCSMAASLHLSSCSLNRSHVCAHVALMACIDGWLVWDRRKQPPTLISVMGSLGGSWIGRKRMPVLAVADLTAARPTSTVTPLGSLQGSPRLWGRGCHRGGGGTQRGRWPWVGRWRRPCMGSEEDL